LFQRLVSDNNILIKRYTYKNTKEENCCKRSRGFMLTPNEQ